MLHALPFQQQIKDLKTQMAAWRISQYSQGYNDGINRHRPSYRNSDSPWYYQGLAAGESDRASAYAEKLLNDYGYTA